MRSRVAVNGGQALEHGRELEERTRPVQAAVQRDLHPRRRPDLGRRVRRGVRARSAHFGRRPRSAPRRVRSRGSSPSSAWAEFLAGRWDEAERDAQEGIELAAQADQEPQRLFALAVRGLVRAARGDVDGGRADAETVLALAPEHGVMFATILGACGMSLLELSHERFDAVHELLSPLGARLEEGGVREPGSVRFLGDEVEALIALGRLDEAAGAARHPRAPGGAPAPRLRARGRRSLPRASRGRQRRPR